jgi:biopolymer transport protein ExbD
MAQLGSQNLAVGTFSRHLLQSKQKKKSRRRALIAGLTLTSMVDMFSLLVIFLLQTFSTSPELVMVTKGVTLPAAISARELEDSPVLAISSEEVYLDQKLIGATQALLLDPTPLMNKLQELREQWQRVHPNQKFNGVISLQADRNLPSTMVSQFMGLLPTQTYSTVQLAVISRGGS